jgi:hypothetical protein
MALANADPLVDAPANLPCTAHQVTWDAAQVHKAFVDAVNLLRVAQACSQAHHAVAHVAVQRKVGRQGNQAGVALEFAQLEVRRAHLDTQGFGFVTAGNGATIVVGQHDHRPALQPGLEDAFARDVKVVAVDEGEHGEGHGQILYK